MKAKPPDNEVTNLEALRFDTEGAFNDISRLAALICGTPVALVRLIDLDRQWYKPKVGWTETESSDQIVFCAYTIKQNGLFIVEDATSDKRFSTAPLVISDPKIRFYAGAPLVTPDGLPLGTLCVMDYIPRSLSLEQQEALQALSRQVITQLELQRNLAKLERNKKESKYAEEALQNVYDELEKRNAELCLANEELQTAIAEFQMAEEELHQQNEKLYLSRQGIETERQRYQDLFDFGPDAYLLTDANGIIQEVNLAATLLLNVSQKYLVGKPLSMFVYKQERQIFLTKLKNLQSVQDWEVLLQPRRGVPVPTAIAVAAVCDLQGNILGWRWQIRDITERKLAEKALQTSEERFELIAQATNDLVWDWDLLTDSVWRNEGNQTLFGYCAEQINPDMTWWYDNIHPDDRERVLSGLHSLLERDESFWSDSYRYRRADGSYGYVCDRSYVMRDEEGKAIRMIGGITDISDRKWAEQKIREQAALLNITTDAIVVRSLENKILFWNQGAERLYGWAEEEVLGKNATEILYKENSPQIKEALSTVVERGAWHGELHQMTKEGKEIIVQSRWVIVRDEQEQTKSILVVNTDITEKKQLESQLLRAQRLESIGTLASGIAHDLNNILAPIIMAVQLLEKEIPYKQKQQLLEILKANGQRGADLVKQVLSFGRGLEGKRTLFQVKHLISEIKQIVKETFPKSIEIYTDIPQELWAISGDITQLHQILMNLCVNARDAMPYGGRLSISAENLFIDEQYAKMNLDAKVGSYIVLTISDTGTGIPPELFDRIFEPFFTTKEVGQGTGLGLYTVLGIIKSHGGFLNVNTQLEIGTEFKVYLPAVEVNEIQKIEEEKTPTGNGELIMVVDDEQAIRDITKMSLEKYAYKVITAKDGIDAVALYAQHRQEISVVITNMFMPEMDGATTIRTLEKMNPNVKIVGVSGLASNEKVASDAGSSVKAFLVKPFTAKELLKTLDGVLSN